MSKKPYWSDSIKKASEAAWAVTTKFRHPHKQKLKWMYRNMVNRCHKPGTRRYERYGGRGIIVCPEWKTNPTAFYEWATTNGYDPALQINRKNNDGNYEPSNCEFVTCTVNQNNTSRSRFLTWDGKTMTVCDWARHLGISSAALQHRVDRDWPAERIFTQPYRHANAA